MNEVKKSFNPEFLNRLDEVILFTQFEEDDLLKITYLLTDQINTNLALKQIKIHLKEDAAKYIVQKTCTDRSYGARPLRRALQKYIEDPLSEALIQGTLARPAEFDVFLRRKRTLLPAACRRASSHQRRRRRRGGQRAASGDPLVYV